MTNGICSGKCYSIGVGDTDPITIVLWHHCNTCECAFGDGFVYCPCCGELLTVNEPVEVVF